MAAARLAMVGSRELSRINLSWYRAVTSASLRSLPSSSSCLNHRSLCTKVLDSTVPLSSAEEKIKKRLNRNFILRFLDWMNSDIGGDQYVMSDIEKNQREDLLKRVQEMYFADPPISPDLQFYKEVFETLIRYEDRLGVQTLWRLMPEMNVQPDSELKSLVEPFLEKTKSNVWFDK